MKPENRFLDILWVFPIMFKILRSRLHYDVIVTSYVDGWYLFWYQWKEETDSHTLVANIGYRTFIIENPGGGCNNPPSPSKDVLQKMPQEDEG